MLGRSRGKLSIPHLHSSACTKIHGVPGSGGRRTHLVDDQEVRLRDTRSTFTRDLITARDVDHVDDIIGEFSRIVGYEGRWSAQASCWLLAGLEPTGQVVTTRLDKEHLRIEHRLKFLQGSQVRTDVLPDSSVGTASGLDGPDSFFGQSLVSD